MTLHAELPLLDRVKRTLVALKMPRALEVFDATLRGIERSEMTAIQAIDTLLAEELAWRETRRIRTALVMARLSTMKTLAGFDFTFQPSLDRDRIFALADSASSRGPRSSTSSDRPAPARAISGSVPAEGGMTP